MIALVNGHSYNSRDGTGKCNQTINGDDIIIYSLLKLLNQLGERGLGT